MIVKCKKSHGKFKEGVHYTAHKTTPGQIRVDVNGVWIKTRARAFAILK